MIGPSVLRYEIVALLLASLLMPSLLPAQTCSCAAVPLLGSMQLASPNDEQWFLSSTYEFHDVSELVSGSSSIPDQTNRNRTSQALIVEASRGLSDRISMSVLLSGVRHEREVSGIQATASGLGDAIAILKYAPRSISLYSKSALSFGLGVRLPLGVDNARWQGITLAEDMQPSTGAYGTIVWAYWAHALNDARSARVYANVSHARNGDNDRKYEFGRDTTLTLGGIYQTQTPWGLGLELLYRDAARDERNAVSITNTGGKWFDVVPAVQYHISENLALKAAAKIPVSRDLNDELQFTTKYALRLSLSYVFGGVERQ